MDKEEFINIVRAEGLTLEEAESVWECRPPDLHLGGDPDNAKHLREVIAETVRHFMPRFAEIREQRRRTDEH